MTCPVRVFGKRLAYRLAVKTDRAKRRGGRGSLEGEEQGRRIWGEEGAMRAAMLELGSSERDQKE